MDAARVVAASPATVGSVLDALAIAFIGLAIIVLSTAKFG
jgi:hypothetical protein